MAQVAARRLANHFYEENDPEQRREARESVASTLDTFHGFNDLALNLAKIGASPSEMALSRVNALQLLAHLLDEKHWPLSLTFNECEDIRDLIEALQAARDRRVASTATQAESLVKKWRDAVRKKKQQVRVPLDASTSATATTDSAAKENKDGGEAATESNNASGNAELDALKAELSAKTEEEEHARTALEYIEMRAKELKETLERVQQEKRDLEEKVKVCEASVADRKKNASAKEEKSKEATVEVVEAHFTEGTVSVPATPAKTTPAAAASTGGGGGGGGGTPLSLDDVTRLIRHTMSDEVFAKRDAKSKVLEAAVADPKTTITHLCELLADKMAALEVRCACGEEILEVLDDKRVRLTPNDWVVVIDMISPLRSARTQKLQTVAHDVIKRMEVLQSEAGEATIAPPSLAPVEKQVASGDLDVANVKEMLENRLGEDEAARVQANTNMKVWRQQSLKDLIMCMALIFADASEKTVVRRQAGQQAQLLLSQEAKALRFVPESEWDKFEKIVEPVSQSSDRIMARVAERLMDTLP